MTDVLTMTALAAGSDTVSGWDVLMMAVILGGFALILWVVSRD